MRTIALAAALGAALAFLGGCTSFGGCCGPEPCATGAPASCAGAAPLVRVADAREAESVEMQVDLAGRPKEVEYHVLPDAVPEAVQKAMNDLHPGAPFIAAEKEYEGGVLYYELTAERDGHEIEAMFTPDGRLHSEEISVPAANVPDAVKDAVARTWPSAHVRSWEEILGGHGELTEYHVKLSQDGMSYKVMVGPGGAVKAAVREVEAEIEVPVPIPAAR